MVMIPIVINPSAITFCQRSQAVSCLIPCLSRYSMPALGTLEKTMPIYIFKRKLVIILEFRSTSGIFLHKKEKWWDLDIKKTISKLKSQLCLEFAILAVNGASRIILIFKIWQFKTLTSSSFTHNIYIFETYMLWMLPHLVYIQQGCHAKQLLGVVWIDRIPVSTFDLCNGHAYWDFCGMQKVSKRPTTQDQLLRTSLSSFESLGSKSSKMRKLSII